jgi:hypothetical protein
MVYNVPGKQEKQEIIENFHKHRVKRGYDKSFHAKRGAISGFFTPEPSGMAIPIIIDIRCFITLRYSALFCPGPCPVLTGERTEPG